MLYLLRRPPLVLICLALAGLSACDRSEEAEPQTTTAQTPVQKVPADAGANADALVNAVSSSTGQGAVELKFNLKQHPQIGQPAELELVLTPTVNLRRLYATFQVSEGLELRSGGEIAGKEKLAAGASLSHLVTFVAKRDGIFYVSAVVVSDAEDTSTSRAYSIPVIAGAGLAPASPTPQTTASVVAASIPESTAQ